MNIGDLLFMLGVDGSRLEADATKEAQKAGDAAGRTLTQRMGAQLKSNGVKVIGTAFAATAAVMTKGALQMEDAIARIRSETGASAEEAEQIARTSNRIAGDQQQSLEAVADVAIAVKKNLGATGEELDRLTDATVKFARVTKQDAVGAVEDMDDIVDAYGLSLDEVTTVQDKLIVSNQKYGGSITENQKALAAMAPQLKALNLTYDDGIELLNLFAASGLDAADGQKALNQAIQKLPEGESLDEFVKRLSAVTDDGDRARLAIEVFGAKAGAKLANAIKPGIGSLDEFGIAAEDAAGATEEAVDALDSSLGGRLRKVLSQAKAALRGFGADFGPGVTAAAGLASLASTLGLRIPLGPFAKLGKKLGGAIASGIGSAIVGNAASGIIGDSIADGVTTASRTGRVKGALSAAGTFLGTTLGAAFSVALAAAAVGALVMVANQLEEDLDKEQGRIADWTHRVIADGTLAGLQKARADIQRGIDDLRNNTALNILEAPGRALSGIFGGKAKGATDVQIEELQARLAEIDKAIAEAGGQAAETAHDSFAPVGPNAADGVASGTDDVIAATTEMAAKAGAAFTDATGAAAFIAGRNIPRQTADGMRSARQVVFDAIDALGEAMKHQMTPWGQAARITGFLVGDQLQKGLHSADPAVRRQAEETRRIAEERLAAIIAGSGEAGRKAGEALKKGLHSKNPAVRAEAQRIQKIVDDKLEAIAPKAGDAGADAGAAFMRRLRAQLARPVSVHVGVIGAGGNNDKGKGNATGGWWPAGQPTWVNEHTAQSEMWVPSASGRFVTHAEAIQAINGAAGGGGGTTYNIPVSVTGVLAARKPDDLARPLRQLAAAGVLTTPADRRRMKVPTRG